MLNTRLVIKEKGTMFSKDYIALLSSKKTEIYIAVLTKFGWKTRAVVSFKVTIISIVCYASSLGVPMIRLYL